METFVETFVETIHITINNRPLTIEYDPTNIELIAKKLDEYDLTVLDHIRLVDFTRLTRKRALAFYCRLRKKYPSEKDYKLRLALSKLKGCYS